MAGEIEETFRLNFQVDSVHSGSISFGRFESEDLCWERRSSFSHNRYLEEVEKCSKPGSVTEKKAYFEAHFKKKGFPGLNSPRCCNGNDYHASENDDMEKMGSDNEVDCVNNCGQFDEEEDFVISFSEPQNELESDTANNKDYITIQVKAVEADGVVLGSSLSINSNSGTEMNGNLDGETAGMDVSHVSSMAVDLFPDNPADEENTDPCPREQKVPSPEERESPEAERAVPRLIPRVRSEQRRSYAAGIALKATEKKSPKTVPVVTTKKTLETPQHHLMNRTSKYERCFKTEGIPQFKREPINRTIGKPQSSTPQKISNRAHQSATSPVGANNPGIRQNNSRSIFKSNGNVQRKKECDVKLEGRTCAWEAKVQKLQNMNQEKKNAEIKQLRKSLIFKATPMPSFYRGDGYKTTNSNNELRSSPGHRPSQRSTKTGVEQNVSRSSLTRMINSTATSDSCGSFGVGTSNRHSQDRMSGVGRKKVDQQKPTSLRKIKVPEGKKPFNGRQETDLPLGGLRTAVQGIRCATS